MWGRERFRVVPSQKRGRKDVYTVKSNRQLVRGTDTRAIGEGRGVACVGGRTIGGDALAMQVHAGRKDTYRVEPARHMHVAADARLDDDCAGEVTLEAGVERAVGLCSGGARAC